MTSLIQNIVICIKVVINPLFTFFTVLWLPMYFGVTAYVTGYLLVLHLLVVQALVPLPCGQMLVGQMLVVTIACEVICLQFSLLVSNMLVAHRQEGKGGATPFRNIAFRNKTVLSCLHFFASPDLTITVLSGSTTNRILCRI